MAANSITIHQGFYGEVNRAHSCIKQTLTDPDLTSFLIAFTDRPAALPPGVTLSPYLSGNAFSKYYVFSKTFPDTSATRAGMVFTHVLILSLEDVTRVHRLHDVLSHFVESTANKVNEIREFQVELSDTLSNGLSKQQPKYIQETISAFTSGIRPILFTGDITPFIDALQLIWNSPNLSSRRNIKFRTSFTLSDIDGIKDLTIVSIQKDFLPKWQGQTIIQGENQEMVEVISHSETLFLGYKIGNPFYNFLVDLDVNLSEVQNYGQYEKVFINYISLDRIEDANILRQDIRTIAKLSPSPNDAKAIKVKFLEQLSILIQNKKDSNIKALRNIDWNAFPDGEVKSKKIVSSYMENELKNPNQKEFQLLSEMIDISITEKEQNWWHTTIIESLTNTFKSQDLVIQKNIWKLLEFSESILKNLLLVISPVKDCDAILRKNIPEKLKTETCKSLIQLSQKKNWYLLHADILLKMFSLEDSIESQLEFEEKLPLANSEGVKYLVLNLTAEQLIFLTLKTNDRKLIALSVDAIEKNVLLLKGIDLSVSAWLDILDCSCYQVQEIICRITW